MAYTHKISVLAGSLTISALLSAPVLAQQTANLQPVSSVAVDQPAAPAPKHAEKKVWTEDSIGEVRSEADRYMDSGQPSAAAPNSGVGQVAPGSDSVPKGVGGPPLVLHIPSTAEETQKAIDQRKSLASNFNNLLSNAKERLKTESDPVIRKTLTEKAGLLEFDIKSTDSEIQTLEQALDDYQHGKSPAASQTDKPAGNSQN